MSNGYFIFVSCLLDGVASGSPSFLALGSNIFYGWLAGEATLIISKAGLNYPFGPFEITSVAFLATSLDLHILVYSECSNCLLNSERCSQSSLCGNIQWMNLLKPLSIYFLEKAYGVCFGLKLECTPLKLANFYLSMLHRF